MVNISSLNSFKISFKQIKVLLKAQHLEFVKIRPDNKNKIDKLSEIFMVIRDMNPESSEFQLQKSEYVKVNFSMIENILKTD